jgi:hypothetical protein
MLRAVFGLLLGMLPALGEGALAGTVPPPFEPLRAVMGDDGAEVALWGRRYRFAGGPLPTVVRSQGRQIFTGVPRFRLGGETVAWQRPELALATPREVRLRSVGAAAGARVEADTRVEYDGMIAVELSVHGARVSRLEYELRLAPEAARFFSHHLPYDYQVSNVDKGRLLESAGLLPDALALPFVPTLALGAREVGVEWWSETNAHWGTAARTPAFAVDRTAAGVRLRITPIAAPLEIDGVWRDRFALFVFPSRPPPRRWRSVRMLPFNRAANFGDASPETRFLWLAMQQGFHAKHDGLPASVDDAFQRGQRERLKQLGVGYMPYGMLTLAPILHPRTMAEFPRWSAEGRWWRLQPGFRNAVIERTRPELRPGAPYTYPVCAAEADYFEWMLGENVRALRDEKLDALYFDHGGITRMCVRSPRLRGAPGRESWEYGNVRRFYKRLYEAVQRERPEARVVIHTHGAPKALGAFVDFHMFGEALNAVFADGAPTADYRARPELYRPDYLALPGGFLEAHFHPRVGGASSLLPQVRWAMDAERPQRSRAHQRALHAIALSNDVHVPLWVSDLAAAEEVVRALDRFGDLGDARVHPWWTNGAALRVPPGLRATLYTKGQRALLVLANFEVEARRGTVRLDAAAFSLPSLSRVRDLERPGASAQALGPNGFDVSVPARDLRLFALE